MAAFYQALLGLEAGAFALAATVLLAAWQLISDRTSSAVANLILGSWLARAGFACLIVAFGATVLGASLLAAPHDLVPWANLDADRWLRQPFTGLLVTTIAVVGTAAVFVSVVRSVRLLDFAAAGRARVERLDCGQWRRSVLRTLDPDPGSEVVARVADALGIDIFVATLWKDQALRDRTKTFTESEQAEFAKRVRAAADARARQVTGSEGSRDPLSDVFDVARAAAVAGRGDRVASVLSALLPAVSSCLRQPPPPGFGPEEFSTALAEDVFEKSAGRLLDSAIEEGRAGVGTAIGDWLSDAMRAHATPSVWIPTQNAMERTAHRLLAARAGGPLASVIADLGEQAVVALRLPEVDRQRRFDAACSALGSLGEQLPALFRDPDAPTPVFPVDEGAVPPDPLDALYESLYEIGERAFPQGRCVVDPLIYRDAVRVTAGALSERIEKYYRDARLELQLVSVARLLGRLAEESAKQADAQACFIAATALSDLAETATQPYYHEYPQDLAMWLTGAGIAAADHKLQAPGLGQTLADWIAEQLVRDLPDQLDYAAHEARVAGQFVPNGDDVARAVFVHDMEAHAGRPLGLRRPAS